MSKIDANADGRIDWQEFINKFKTTDLDERLKERAKDKMARLKELMIMHMTSPIDAFRFVSTLLITVFVCFSSMRASWASLLTRSSVAW